MRILLLVIFFLASLSTVAGAEEIKIDGFLNKLFGSVEFAKVLESDIRQGEGIDLTFSEINIQKVPQAQNTSEDKFASEYMLTLTVHHDMGDAFRTLGTVSVNMKSIPRGGTFVEKVTFVPVLKN